MDEKKKILVLGKKGRDISLALELCSRDTEVYYYTERNPDFPKVEAFSVGFGMERFGLHLVNDFYSILKTAKDKENWVVVLTDPGFGDMAKWLREDEWLVFGADKEAEALGVNTDKGWEFLQKAGIDIPAKNQPKALPGFEVDTIAFFNGEEFLRPTLRQYKNDGGGYLNWFKQCPLFDMGLSKLRIPLKQMGFQGVVTFEGVFIPKGMWDGNQPVEDLYIGNHLLTSCEFPASRVYFKMIENLAETLEETASGGDEKIKLLKKDAFYFNGFRIDEGIREDDFYSLGKIYEFEREDPERFGVAFEQVTMDSTGDLNALPNNYQIFQVIGFGNSYLESISAATDLLYLGQSYVKFKTSRQETLENIRDRVVFVESWLGEKNEDQDENN